MCDKFNTLGSFVWTDHTTLESLVARQAEYGLTEATDGHRGRREWATDFFGAFNGMEKVCVNEGHLYQPVPAMTSVLKLVGPISAGEQHPAITEFKQLSQACADYNLVPKATVPAPAYFMALILNETPWNSIYADTAELAADIVLAYTNIIDALHRAGCRDILFEDYAWTRLMDDRGLKELLQGGHDVVEYINTLAECDKAVFAACPKDMSKGLYIARDTYDVPGTRPGSDYSLIAPALFADLAVDVLYLDLDADATSDFNFLENVTASIKIMLGVISPSDFPTDSRRFIKSNFNEAAKHFPAENLGITFQCGMAEHPALYTDPEIQWRIVDEAREMVADCLAEVAR